MFRRFDDKEDRRNMHLLVVQKRRWLAPAILVVAALLLGGGTAHARKSKRLPDTQRLPYERGKLYEVRLIPGSPFVVELPAGERAAQLWYDDRWWVAETVPSGTRVILWASTSPEIEEEVGLIHIETEPSNLRISMRVQAVADKYEPVSAALELYLEKSPLNDPVRLQARRLADKEMIYAERMTADKIRSEVAAFRTRAIERMRTNFDWGGDFRIKRVADDGVQTFILLEDSGSDRAVIQFVDKSGKAETVNHELENGSYVVQNKVLARGEKFRLVLGKQQSWVALK
jgi:hypothetical protein